jgi:hypothetical protein
MDKSFSFMDESFSLGIPDGHESVLFFESKMSANVRQRRRASHIRNA